MCSHILRASWSTCSCPSRDPCPTYSHPSRVSCSFCSLCLTCLVSYVILRCWSCSLNAKREVSVRMTSTRKSYKREKKLVRLQKISVDRKRVWIWAKMRKAFFGWTVGPIPSVMRKKSKYLLMEKKLHIEFLQLRKKWTSVKIWWYTLRGDHMPSDLYLETKFKFPGYWFNHFTKRKTMQLREKADKSRKNSANFRFPI